MFSDIFRLDAAGRIKRALMSKIPIPLDRQCHNERNDNSKDILHQTHGNIAALCQGCMDADSIQLVDGKAPEYQSHRKDQDQIDDLPRRNAQDISHQNSGILLKLPPLDRIARPIAVLQLAKTEMMVSVAARFLRLI